MGIYIKGMEMPKESRMTLQISAEGAVYVVNGYSITAETYAADAVPVPPHGRLIDADKLIKGIAMERKGWFDNADSYIAERIVFDAPTIIPAEEESK